MNVRILLSCLVILILTTGCPIILDLNLITVDKNEVYIPQEGGTDTITMLDNYDLWCISFIHEAKVKKEFSETCQCQKTSYFSEKRYYFAAEKRGINLVNEGWYSTPDSSHIETDWVDVQIPKDDPRKVIVSCNANTEEHDRYIRVILFTPGDENTLCEIEFFQDKKDE